MSSSQSGGGMRGLVAQPAFHEVGGVASCICAGLRLLLAGVVYSSFTDHSSSPGCHPLSLVGGTSPLMAMTGTWIPWWV